MSFGGSVSAMVSSLKNNARPKRKTYFDRNNAASKNKSGKNKLLDKKATPEQLEEIKRKLFIENKRIRNKNILIYSCAIILILLGIIYLDM